MVTVVTVFQADQPTPEKKIGFAQSFIAEHYNDVAAQMHEMAQAIRKFNTAHPLAETCNRFFAVATEHGPDIIVPKLRTGNNVYTETKLGTPIFCAVPQEIRLDGI